MPTEMHAGSHNAFHWPVKIFQVHAQVLEMCVRRLQSGCMFRAFDGWVSRVDAKKAAREKMQLVGIAFLEGTKVQTHSKNSRVDA